ncbi:DUF5329 family protein [Pontibacter cellulosilyticus]|uniref:DUF5329 family protein n=1 Tax=Pontibacter cellulosilyticus TaxID=1720253 RepID=A0A923SIY1_9BACT|nr:DUF5329 family protein [Pontibacter cellulosilyticus]MBC5993082.1 DUF5329 family protein [Pontibacter cellulosilyticus]
MLRYVMLGFILLLSSGSLLAGNTLLPAGSVKEHTKVELTEVQKVHRLIQFVRGMKDATFVRNGSEHTCKEAADHLQSKWEKHKNSIGSARDFIEKLASKSGFSGEPYKIRFKDGTEHTTNAILTKELERLESL